MERQIISSRQNPLIKLVCGLADKKNRRKEGLFRFDGIKLLAEAVGSHMEIEYLVCREGAQVRIDSYISAALAEGLLDADRIVYVSEGVFGKMSEESSPEGVICVCKVCERLHTRTEALADGNILLLESVRDPGNLGTVMRSAYALGIDTLVLTDDCADIYNPKTVRAAMGAVFKMRTQTVACEALPEMIERFRGSGRRVYAAALSEDARPISEVGMRCGDCFVIGNEGHGLSARVIEACDMNVIIPMREDAESLNAASAAVICIWETVKHGKVR